MFSTQVNTSHYQDSRNFRREYKSQTVRISRPLMLSPLEMRESEIKNKKNKKTMLT
jgi:hypothetical protein